MSLDRIPKWPVGSAGEIGLKWTLPTRPSYLSDQVFNRMQVEDAIKALGMHERNVIELDRSKFERESKTSKKVYKPDDEIPHIDVS